MQILLFYVLDDCCLLIIFTGKCSCLTVTDPFYIEFNVLTVYNVILRNKKNALF